MRVEELQGIQGRFYGSTRDHPDPKLKFRCLADGTMTYLREIGGVESEVTVKVEGVSVRRISESTDFRRYIRIERGPKGNRDKIIGLIDKD